MECELGGGASIRLRDFDLRLAVWAEKEASVGGVA